MRAYNKLDLAKTESRVSLAKSVAKEDEDYISPELQVSGASIESNYTREVAEARRESQTAKQKNMFHLDFRKLDTTMNESANDIEQDLNG